MAVNVTTVWRVRPGGINTNGGGFDCSISSAATGTNGSFSGTTFKDTVAAAFTSGMVGSSINILGVGQYSITGFISSSQITLASGNPALTLAGPLIWTVGGGTDYSQQNAAQATGTHGTVNSLGTSTTSNTIPATTGGSFTWTTSVSFGLANGTPVIAFDTGTPANFIQGTVTSNVGTSLTITCTGFGGSGAFTTWTFGSNVFVDATASAFTSAMVGNIINLGGAGFQSGWYSVIGFTSATTVTLDRAPGVGTTATWNLGGAFADPFTNFNTTVNAASGGGQIYILGSGSPNPSSYTYDYNMTAAQVVALTSNFLIFANDPATPGYKAPPDTSGGMPVVKVNMAATQALNCSTNNCFAQWRGIYFVGTAAGYQIVFGTSGSSSAQWILTFGCVYDMFGNDTIFQSMTTSGGANLCFGVSIGCEIFSSISAAATIGGYAYGVSQATLFIKGCNIHDVIWHGIELSSSSNNIFSFTENIIAKCPAIGIWMIGAGPGEIKNNTIDGNGTAGSAGNLDGIKIDTPGVNLYGMYVINNIITNHTQAGAHGINANFPNTAGNTPFTFLMDYNVYYNNTANLGNLTYGPHDTVLGSSPYVGSGTENYTLA